MLPAEAKDFTTKGVWFYIKLVDDALAMKTHSNKLRDFINEFQGVFNNDNSNPEKPSRIYHIDVINIELTPELKKFFNTIYRDQPATMKEPEKNFICV